MPRINIGAALVFCCVSLVVACADDSRAGSGVTYGGEGTHGEGDGDSDGETDGEGDGGGDGDGVELCDPWAQDCPVGEKCVPAATQYGAELTINKCVPVLGTGQAGDPCTSAGFIEATDDCGADSFCWNGAWLESGQGQELVGACTAFCEGTPGQPSCAPGTTCIIKGSEVVKLCVDGCDPVAQDCNTTPHEQIGCYVVEGSFVCVHSTLDIPLGEPCNYVNDCAPGGVCVPGESLPSCAGEACCTAVCDLDGPQCSALPGTECTPLFEPGEAPIGFEHVGICQGAT